MKAKSQNGFAVPVIIFVAALVIALGGTIYFTAVNKPVEHTGTQEVTGEGEMSEETMTETEAAMEKEGEAMMEEEGLMEVDKNAMAAEGGLMEYSGAVLAGESAPLLDFQKTDYETALKSDRLIVLYFYANWCPICKAEFPLMQGAFNDLTTNEVVGFRVNYNDNETDADETALAREFGVAYQHTKVFVRTGERLLKAPDSWSKSKYLSEIEKIIGQ